jgi:twitching motility protein PilT
MSTIQEKLIDLYSADAEGKIPAITDVRVASEEPLMALYPDGWRAVGEAPLPPVAVQEFVSWLSPNFEERLKDREAIEGTMDIEFAEGRSVNFRCSIYHCLAGEKLSAVIRVQNKVAPDLEDLGFGPMVKSFVNAKSGLLLVCGPTSSGKSTTIGSLLQTMLNERPVHVVTIEQPIEYVLNPGKGLVSQRSVPDDVPTFSKALEEAMRQRPDVLMVGEVRTREEAEIAIRAAEHGRYVMLTTHAKNALGGIQKLLGFFPPDEAISKAQSLSNTLIGVIHQQLLSNKDATRRVLGYELMHLQGNQEALGHIANPERLQNLQKMLVGGAMRLSKDLNNVLATMVRQGEVADTEAIAVSYDVPGLKQLIGGGIVKQPLAETASAK